MKNHGPCIYFDTSTKGLKRKRHNTYRADVTIRGVRYRKRSKDTRELARWLRGMKG
jgi:hypothetical protein